MRTGIIFIAALCTLALSCAKEPESMPEALVVEGWIDEGGYPIVSVTTTMARPEGHHDMAELYGHIVRGAQVSVSDGTRTVGLVGRPSSDNFPPYVYSTVRMKGVAGRTYTLKVVANGVTATARTTIPASQELTEMKIKDTEGGYKLDCKFISDGESYYGFFEKDEKNIGWSPVFLSLVNGRESSGEQTVTVARGTGLSNYASYVSGFESGEKVQVRFCTMDEGIWRWWQTFQEMTGVALMMTYPIEEVLPSNVEGAYGYWAGYGATTYTETMPKN